MNGDNAVGRPTLFSHAIMMCSVTKLHYLMTSPCALHHCHTAWHPKAYPGGPNLQFYHLLASPRIAEYSYFMQLEADVVPIRDGWLNAIQRSVPPTGSPNPWWIKGSTAWKVSNVGFSFDPVHGCVLWLWPH